VIGAFAAATVIGFGVAAVVAWLIARNAARLGLLDVPNERSSHVAATPRGGGIGIVAGVAAAVIFFGIIPSPLLDLAKDVGTALQSVFGA